MRNDLHGFNSFLRRNCKVITKVLHVKHSYRISRSVLSPFTPPRTYRGERKKKKKLTTDLYSKNEKLTSIVLAAISLHFISANSIHSHLEWRTRILQLLLLVNLSCDLSFAEQWDTNKNKNHDSPNALSERGGVIPETTLSEAREEFYEHKLHLERAAMHDS